MPGNSTHDSYKMLDFSQVLAGPTVTQLSAEMGAEVIKIELPPAGDRSLSVWLEEPHIDRIYPVLYLPEDMVGGGTP
jgi:crotonobetainyl-CoA:carnitine CoA-transferase CaiB-like acyl-CoA transferase